MKADLDRPFDAFDYFELVRLRSYQQDLVDRADVLGIVHMPIGMIHKLAELETRRAGAIRALAKDWGDKAKGRPILRISEVELTPPLPHSGNFMDTREIRHREIELPSNPAWREVVLEAEAKKFLTDLWEKQSKVKE